jgi:hypothetical protein
MSEKDIRIGAANLLNDKSEYLVQEFSINNRSVIGARDNRQRQSWVLGEAIMQRLMLVMATQF